MALVLEQVSVVLVARQHNPSILNPDFLRDNGIVPGGWQTRSPPITTEVFAQATFQEGLQFTAEPDKLAITAHARQLKDPVSTLQSAAERYVEVLPHVPYTAVGLNSIYSLPMDDDDPNEQLVEKAFRSDLTNLTYRNTIPRTSATLHYSFDDYKANISLNTGTVKQDDQPMQALIFSFNGHHGLPEKAGAPATLALIKKLGVKLEEHRTMLDEVFLDD